MRLLLSAIHNPNRGNEDDGESDDQSKAGKAVPVTRLAEVAAYSEA